MTVDEMKANSLAPVYRVPPFYPRAALENGVQGWVCLRFSVDASGHVIDPLVFSSAPSDVFDEAAIHAVSQWRYKQNAPDTPRPQVVVLNFELAAGRHR